MVVVKHNPIEPYELGFITSAKRNVFQVNRARIYRIETHRGSVYYYRGNDVFCAIFKYDINPDHPTRTV